ncbi:MAG TPA: protein kinase [Pyrinomonadaceae bacterium]|jgi:serine/threonine protein kinase|nr:protein kinase [Pyrinomonadaceae bacterium]
MKQLAPNTMIGSRYLVVQSIGKGGMGEVYLAVDQRLGSAVALKRTRFESDSTLGNAFEREARILARLRHPVLPKVIDHFIEGEGQFLVMENISGDDLGKRLANANKPFPLSWVMFWADQLLDALNYLHSHEPPIIHRDIKPENLKLTDENHIILLDFGLSKDFETGSKEAPATGSVVGYSPHFASMEQVRGTGTDARSDIYSLSATLYQFLSNLVPPDALTRAEAILGGNDDPIKPLTGVNDEVTKPISDAILHGLSVRQDQRWASALDMQKALRRAFNAPKNAASDAKPASEAKTRMIETAPPLAATVPIDTIDPMASSLPEMATAERIHISAPPADVTARMEPSAAAEQAGIQTAILPTPQQTQQPIVAAAAAGGEQATGTTGHSLVAPTQEKKASKIPLIVGALIGLLLIAGIAGGGGWYYYKNYYAVKVDATPTPAPSVEPTPIPTVNVVETSTPESNTAVTSDTNTTPAGDNRDVTTGGPTIRPTPQVVAKSTPGATKPPTTKSTPKKSDDRTTILQ